MLVNTKKLPPGMPMFRFRARAMNFERPCNRQGRQVSLCKIGARIVEVNGRYKTSKI